MVLQKEPFLSRFLSCLVSFYLEMHRLLAKTAPTFRNAMTMRFFGSQVRKHCFD